MGIRRLAAIALSACLASPLFADGEVSVEGLGTFSKEELLETLVTGDPTNPNVERLDGHLGEALGIFERAFESSPKDGRWAAGIALVMNRQGETDEAYDWARKAAKLSPENADAQYTLGTVAGAKTENAGLFSKLGYANKCKDAFKRAVKIDPDHFPSRVGLVMYYTFAPGIAGGSWSKAYEQAEAIIEIPGYADDGYALMALTASHKGDWEKYDRSIESALELAESPMERDDIHTDAAYVTLFKRGDAAGSLEHLDTVTDELVMRTSSYVFVRANALMQLGRHAEAVEWHEKMLELKPDDESSSFFLALSAAQDGQHERARDAYERYLDRFPKGEFKREAERGLRSANEKLGRG